MELKIDKDYLEFILNKAYIRGYKRGYDRCKVVHQFLTPNTPDEVRLNIEANENTNQEITRLTNG